MGQGRKQDSSEQVIVKRFMEQLDDSTSAFIYPFTLENSNEPEFKTSLTNDSVSLRVIMDRPFNKAILFRIEGLNSNFKLTVKQQIDEANSDSLLFSAQQTSFNSPELQEISQRLIKGEFFSLPKIQDGTIVNHPIFYSFEISTSKRTHFSKGPHLNEELIQLMEFLINYGHSNGLLDMEK